MSLQRLRSLARDEMLTADDVFTSIHSAGSILAESDREDGAALETAIRLLEAKRTGQLPAGCEASVDFLAEECGLYPYIDPERFSFTTQTVIQAHSVDFGQKLYLHSKQMQVLLWLLAGDNVILSAPTSFGKSLLVDAFIAKSSPHTVVMILPTIALIDECRRRIIKNFGHSYSIVTTTTDPYEPKHPTIFILTQERFIQRTDNLNIDLLFVDEFYKLDPDRDDGRFETLNLAIYKALPRARQCFMAGPHIRDINLGERWTGNFRFVRTDYRTVTVNIIDRSAEDGRLGAFLRDLKGTEGTSSLVFTATPGGAVDLLKEVVSAGIAYHSDLGKKLGEWISTNYHAKWPVAQGAEHGIAVHHGRLPRSLAQLFVRLFDAGEIRVLICTSTLIEGVNTAAANVFVYDKEINRTDFDFFSFANIRGRVGRMMRHFVGNAYLYHSPPQESDTIVDVPVLSDPGSASDYLIANVSRPELSTEGRSRQDELPEITGLPMDILRQHGSIGVDLLVTLHAKVREILERDTTLLEWAGLPNSDQRKALAELALLVSHASRSSIGIHTAPQVAWAWSQLRYLNSLPKFIGWFAETFGRGDEEQGVDAAFQFLQACEFSFPRTIAAVEALVGLEYTEREPAYGLFLVAMENWFRPVWMKQLEEAGIPIPLAERLQKFASASSKREEVIDSLRFYDFSSDAAFDDVDRFIISAALE